MDELRELLISILDWWNEHQYEIMKETESLTVEIDEILNELTSTYNKP